MVGFGLCQGRSMFPRSLAVSSKLAGWLADKNALVDLGVFQVKELQEGLHNFFSVDVFVLRLLHLAPA